MIKSMTGYGKSEAILESGKLTVEIRSVNGKSADINIKTTLLPKDKEMSLRKRLSDKLQRGTIDFFLSYQANESDSAKAINTTLAGEYLKQMKDLAASVGAPNVFLTAEAAAISIGNVLRMPDVLDASRKEIINEDNWAAVSDAIDKALDAIDKYRIDEGVSLYRDVTSRIGTILGLYNEVESHEKERMDAVREKILKAAEECQIKPDKERFEQEMIFYLEKMDINEEKVRLRQHCKYFMDTIDSEDAPGKKLGFIIQEMGREINTTGSKANHAAIQQCVVKMKDELEKIREQSMNIL